MNNEIEHSFSFESGHVSPLCESPCAHLAHGHSYLLILRCEPCLLQADCEIVHAMIERYFHGKWLNDSLNIACPELAHLAEWIFHFLDSKIAGLMSVKLYDSPANHRIVHK